MKLYKYRSVQQFEFVADILCNSRLYAAQYFDMNDPMEGLFEYDPDTKREYLDSIREGKERIRIVSLSKKSDNLLLWAHYADGFKGICIEFEVDDHPSFDRVEVTYSPFRTYFTNADHQRITEWPRFILRGKNEAWEYEDEVRLLSSGKFVSDGIKVSSVLIGLRTQVSISNTIFRLADGRFPVFKTELCNMTNSVKLGTQISRMQLECEEN